MCISHYTHVKYFKENWNYVQSLTGLCWKSIELYVQKLESYPTQLSHQEILLLCIAKTIEHLKIRENWYTISIICPDPSNKLNSSLHRKNFQSISLFLLECRKLKKYSSPPPFPASMNLSPSMFIHRKPITPTLPHMTYIRVDH